VKGNGFGLFKDKDPELTAEAVEINQNIRQ
jgi:hypothetical protein